MHENRRIRFASIEGLQRSDLPIAVEIWLEELCQQFWATRDMVKLATLFKRHMQDPDPERLNLSYIDRYCQLERKQVNDSLRLMYTYGVVESFSLEDEQLRASLSLSLLQRLRTLELSERFKKITTVERNAPHIPAATPSDRWVPSTVDPVLCDETTSESTDAVAQLSQSPREDDTSPFRVIPLL